MTRIAVIYHSGYGHTKLQAEAVHEGAASVEGVEAVLMTAEEATDRMADLEGFDGMIWGSPTYMGTVSAPMKAFIDATSKPWMEHRWKDKVAAAFTNSSSPSGDKVNTLQTFAVLAAQHGMIFVGQGELPEGYNPDFSGEADEAVNRLGGFLGAMAQSENREPGPDNPPSGDIKTARLHGVRVAEATKRWMAGR